MTKIVIEAVKGSKKPAVAVVNVMAE